MHKRIQKLLSIVFSKEILLDSDMGRSNRRFRRIGRAAIASLVNRVINVGTGLVTAPLTLAYLGADRFGLWMALTGFVSFLAFTDLGLGIGLQNALSRCDGNNDENEPTYFVSSAMFLMIVIAVSLILFSFYAMPFLPIEKIIKVNNSVDESEILATAQAIVFIFAVGLPCGLIQKILVAYQDGFTSDLLLGIGRLCSLIGVFLCVWLKASLPALAVVYMGGPFIILGLSTVYIFNKRPFVRPRVTCCRLNYLKTIAKTGIFAVGAQIGAVIMVSGPLLLVANRFDTLAVVPFSVTQRFLGVSGLLLGVTLAPLWPAYGEACARGDMAWVERTFKKSLWLTAGVSFSVFVFSSIFGRAIIEAWMGNKQAVPSWSLLMACNLWSLLMAWNVACAMLLNGLGHFQGQSVYGVVIPAMAVGIGYLVADGTNLEEVIWVVVLVGEILRGSCLGCEAWWVLKKRRATCS